MAIKFKGSEISGAVPSGLGERELAWQIADKKIFTADSSGTLIEFEGTDTNNKVSISISDTTPDFLDNKLSTGPGITKVKINSSANEVLRLDPDVWLDNINGDLIPVYTDTNRNKVLSVETQNILWSENRLSSTEWVGLSRAVDKLSGWVAVNNCTIVGYMGHTSEAGNTTKPIDLYIDDVKWGTLFSFAGSSTEDYQINNDISIDVNAGQKIRLKCGGGPTIQDTVIELRIKWKLRDVL